MTFKVMRSIVPAVLAVVLVAAVSHTMASDGSATHHGGHMMMHRGMRALGIPMPLLLKAANLTDAQKSQIKTIVGNRRATVWEQRKQIKSARAQLATAYASTGQISASDLLAQQKKISDLRAQIDQERLQDALAIRALLTPDQLKRVADTQAKLTQLRAEMRQLWAPQGAPAATATD